MGEMWARYRGDLREIWASRTICSWPMPPVMGRLALRCARRGEYLTIGLLGSYARAAWLGSGSGSGSGIGIRLGLGLGLGIGLGLEVGRRLELLELGAQPVVLLLEMDREINRQKEIGVGLWVRLGDR